MYKFKQKLLIIFKENKVVGLTIILSLILIISLFTYGKNKNNVFVPNMDNKIREEYIYNWHKAVNACINWSK